MLFGLPINVVDFHSQGEPSRMMVSGGPDFGASAASARLRSFCNELEHRCLAIICEPCSSEVAPGALVLDSVHPGSSASVIFRNSAGHWGVGGHGGLGVFTTRSARVRVSCLKLQGAGLAGVKAIFERAKTTQTAGKKRPIEEFMEA